MANQDDFTTQIGTPATKRLREREGEEEREGREAGGSSWRAAKALGLRFVHEIPAEDGGGEAVGGPSGSRCSHWMAKLWPMEHGLKIGVGHLAAVSPCMRFFLKNMKQGQGHPYFEPMALWPVILPSNG